MTVHPEWPYRLLDVGQLRSTGHSPTPFRQVVLKIFSRCNLACDYCFQKEHPAFGKMNAPTEDATVEWILRAIDERNLRSLHVHYFGGEPLTRKDFVLRTAEILSTAMAARGGTFYGQAMTAGHIYTVAGNGKEGFSGDGHLATKTAIGRPQGLAVGSVGASVAAFPLSSLRSWASNADRQARLCSMIDNWSKPYRKPDRGPCDPIR